MAGQTHGNRSPVTCHLRCGNACFVAAPNTTETSYFRDIAAKALSRRAVVGSGVAVAALTAVPMTPAAATPGKGGGHGTMAGGYVTIPKTAADGGRAIERMLGLRFALALKKNPERLAPIDLAKVELAAPEPPERQAP